jgi:hypothetical protein
MLKLNSGLFVKKAIRRNPGKQIHQKIGCSPVPGMLYLTDVFQFIVNGLNNI